MSTDKKMPRLMKDVYADVFAHPFYKTEEAKSAVFALGVGANGISWCTRQNNKWAREHWAWAYLAGPKPSNCEDFPEFPQ